VRQLALTLSEPAQQVKYDGADSAEADSAVVGRDLPYLLAS